MPKNNKPQETKSKLHPRSQHRERYNFDILIEKSPELKAFVSPNKYGDLSVNFFDPKAVKALNKALLNHHYNIAYWDIPNQFLCPPIPGRADYIHYVADLLGDTSRNTKIKGLDIGTGANCIYPLIGHQSYGWQFVGTDIDESAVECAKDIISKNKNLNDYIEIRLQENTANKLKGILHSDEQITFVMCNPPFHASAEEAKKATLRKLRNLKGKNHNKATLNFGGQHNELWCKGGESRFIKDLIYESRHFSKQCKWFTTLVSKESTLKGIYTDLKKVKAKEVKTIDMGQGQKISRIVAWSFE
ncbi:23S rRNA (adenine(1618)-N(6))-methyltransferase [Winogradskyella sp. PC-19]|uniref:23S rRNA (adenine(1618)-N(6))-methyltransferase RlmF n=1 Tax=unclassified Winogradskyella TaxID=2615021 RepID=UPI000B3CF957|nr:MULTISPECIES: 23S rRNA (adenine(1618)-N(6))-methyltransferase RlmF [unclassified Winogradskyella]ARV09041.1 23S rRNA (adenine(1618)-N(6))-methyltransferase [Winogradskyella sp. PC-19]RZN77637.1 MAG: 23S rRNA (adenine(1618)-N(6))-methyltransferase RlmF [Winogradskyella sp.]